MPEPKRLLLFPAGIAQREAFETAREMGLFIVAVDRDPTAPCRDLCDEFHQLDPGDADALERFTRRYHAEKPLAGALLVGADIPVSWARAARILGSPAPSPEAAALTTNKLAMKRAFVLAGVPVPEFLEPINAEQARRFTAQLGGRAIIKPNDSCGARGVRQVRADTDFQEAFDQAKLHASRGRVILERFEAGPQISIEGLVHAGQVHVTGFADRNYEMLDRLFPYVVENGATIPTALEEEQVRGVTEVFCRGVEALGIEAGVAKGDMVLTPQGAKVIEIAARMSGGKFASQLVPQATGVHLLRAAIRLATGLDPDVSSLSPSRSAAAAVRYFFPSPGVLEAVEGATAARTLPGLTELVVTYAPGETIPPIRSHPDRGGWVVCYAPSREAAVRTAEQAISSVVFRMRATP